MKVVIDSVQHEVEESMLDEAVKIEKAWIAQFESNLRDSETQGPPYLNDGIVDTLCELRRSLARWMLLLARERFINKGT